MEAPRSSGGCAVDSTQVVVWYLANTAEPDGPVGAKSTPCTITRDCAATSCKESVARMVKGSIPLERSSGLPTPLTR